MSNDIPDDPAYNRLLSILARQAAEADAAAAPLRTLQLAEEDLISAGRINPAAGEYLAAFGLINDTFVCDIRRASDQKLS